MKLVDQNTCLPLFQKPIIHTILPCRKIYNILKQSSSIPFSRLQYYNGTNLKGKYGNLQLCSFSEILN